MAVPKIWRKIPEYYNLIGKLCPECSTYYFPKRTVCKKCGCIEMQDFKYSGKGEIVTYTVIRTPLTDPEKEILEIPSRAVPYVLSIVRLKEGPMVTAQIVDCSEKELKIGAKVESVFRKIQEKGSTGVIQYGYKFKIVR